MLAQARSSSVHTPATQPVHPPETQRETRKAAPGPGGNVVIPSGQAQAVAAQAEDRLEAERWLDEGGRFHGEQPS